MTYLLFSDTLFVLNQGKLSGSSFIRFPDSILTSVFTAAIALLFTPTPITPLIGVEPVQLWGQRDCPSPKATLNGQSLLQFAPLSNKNFAKTGVGVNCNAIAEGCSFYNHMS